MVNCQTITYLKKEKYILYILYITFHNLLVFSYLNIMHIPGIGNSLALIVELRITVPFLNTSMIKKTQYAKIKIIRIIIKHFLKLEIDWSSVFRRLKSLIIFYSLFESVIKTKEGEKKVIVLVWTLLFKVEIKRKI